MNEIIAKMDLNNPNSINRSNMIELANVVGLFGNYCDIKKDDITIDFLLRILRVERHVYINTTKHNVEQTWRYDCIDSENGRVLLIGEYCASNIERALMIGICHYSLNLYKTTFNLDGYINNLEDAKKFKDIHNGNLSLEKTINLVLDLVRLNIYDEQYSGDKPECNTKFKQLVLKSLKIIS